MTLPEIRKEICLNAHVIHDLEQRMTDAKGDGWKRLNAKLSDARDYQKQLRSRRDRLEQKQRSK